MAGQEAKAVRDLDPRWTRAWGALDVRLAACLTNLGMVGPSIWAGIDQRDVPSLADAIGWEAATDEREGHFEAMRNLVIAASATARAHQERLLRISPAQASFDADMAKREREKFQTNNDLRRMEVERVKLLPSTWTCRRFRRREAAASAEERQAADEELRSKWADRVVSLVAEAELPFATTMAQDKLNPVLARRCCRGLRAATLRKRVNDWRGCRRYLLGAYGHPFPREVSELITYIELKLEEGAARTWFASLAGALQFMEAAGEVEKTHRLSDQPAFMNAVREATAERARKTPATERKGRQAPPCLIAIIVALERVVVSESAQAYARAYAWFKLVRHWASLRWDDTRSIRPQSFESRARGVFAQIERSKTSGADKAVSVLPIFVSNTAYIEVPNWMEVGLTIWTAEPFSYERDYLLPLPSPDMTGVYRRRAEYADASVFTQRLLRMLENDEGGALLDPAATGFWSEHSDRAGIDSWLAALGIKSEERNFLGRWGVKSSADTYARTATRIIENMQNHAAAHARESHSGGADFFGEEQTLSDMRKWMLTKGATEAAADYLVGALSVADYNLPVADCTIQANPYGRVPKRRYSSLSPAPSAATSATSTISFGSGPKSLLPTTAELSAENLRAVEILARGETEASDPGSPTIFSGALSLDESVWDDGSETEHFSEQGESEPPEDFSEDVPEEDVDLLEISEEQEQEAKNLQEPDEAVPPKSGFVIAFSDKGRMRRLHYVGACFRVPGEHYRQYTCHGDMMPEDNLIDARCKQCFPEGRPAPTPPGEVDSGDEEDSTSSSRSSGFRRSLTPVGRPSSE